MDLEPGTATLPANRPGEMVTSIHILQAKRKGPVLFIKHRPLDSVSTALLGHWNRELLMTAKIACAIKVGPSKKYYKMYSCVAKLYHRGKLPARKPRFL
jgi:hypothetical protein